MKILAVAILALQTQDEKKSLFGGSKKTPAKLEIRKIDPNGLAIHRIDLAQPLVVQNARTDFRPYIHPI